MKRFFFLGVKGFKGPRCFFLGVVDEGSLCIFFLKEGYESGKTWEGWKSGVEFAPH